MGYDTYESDGHSDFAVQDILVKFAEPREKRIAELEEENAYLRRQFERIVNDIKDCVDPDARYNVDDLIDDWDIKLED